MEDLSFYGVVMGGPFLAAVSLYLLFDLQVVKWAFIFVALLVLSRIILFELGGYGSLLTSRTTLMVYMLYLQIGAGALAGYLFCIGLNKLYVRIFWK